MYQVKEGASPLGLSGAIFSRKAVIRLAVFGTVWPLMLRDDILLGGYLRAKEVEQQ